MAHNEQREFCERVKKIHPNFFKNKKVLDIGSLDVNGNNKYLFENCTYIGIDLGEGPNVDVVGSGHLYDAPDNYFDVIISTEAFEHDMFYEKTIANIIRMLKPGGLFVFTCAAPGRAEHGTRRSAPWTAPLLKDISEEWGDYYKNLTPEDIRKSPGFELTFPDGYFEINNNAEFPSDLYFYGVKGGEKYLFDAEENFAENRNQYYRDDIFVVDCWTDTEEKETALIYLIKRLQIYNIPIVLTGHYPVKPEIQKMVNYYLFDKNNPILMREQFGEYGVNSVRWTQIGDTHIENTPAFHHDYAIWETMRNAFNFCKYLGKKTIHFMEYDNLPDPIQYRQTFMENHRHVDAILYEYTKGSSLLPEPYVATYIFSINTDIAVKVIDLIKTKEEFFMGKPNGWQLERNFFTSLVKVTANIFISQYIPNDNELNTQAAWNRNGIERNGAEIQLYLALDMNSNINLHVISGNNDKVASSDYLIEVSYMTYKKFHNITRKGFFIYDLGPYKKGHTVKVYYQGKEIFNEFLGIDENKYWEANKLTKNFEMQRIKSDPPKTININFVDGPFVEILNDQEKLYHVEFINTKTNLIEYAIDLKSNHWAKSSKRYSVDWLIRIKGVDNDYYYEHQFNPEGKTILISFESRSLGDTLAWMGYVEKLRIEKHCNIVCSTFHNNLFRGQYLNIEFVEPGATVNNIYALFRVGVFLKTGGYEEERHPSDPKREPLTKIASDILGLDFTEVRPKLPVFTTEKKKIASIAIHATAQCKYWNNPTGWQKVVDYLKSEGYEVKLLSKEENGYMGNKNPRGVTNVPPGKIEGIIKILQESEIFIGISSGLAWLSWAVGTETILISGFTDVFTEPTQGVRRIINKDVCNSCWSDFTFDPGDWNWCPRHKGTNREFECSKLITADKVIEQIKLGLNK